MSDPAPTTPPDAPAISSPLDADILCVKCHYNLRGLDTHQRCPECGLLIAVSLPTRRAVTAADWINIRRALLFVIIANVTILPIAIAAWLGHLWLPPSRGQLAVWSSVPIILALIIFRAVGYARLAAVDRAFDRSPLEWDAHLAVSRMAWARAFIAIPLVPLVIVYAAASPWGHDREWSGPLVGVVGFAYLICGGLQFAGLQYLLTRLGYRSRIPDLGNTTTAHAALCIITAVIGGLTAGIFAFLCWITYHALLGRYFWLASQRSRDYRQST